MEKITYIDPNLPPSNQVDKINRNLSILQGAWESQNADKQELDSIYGAFQMSREWKRDQGIGNTTGTYTGWTHVQAEAGYSVWKYTLSDFEHSPDNKLYLDGKSLEYRGQASSESSTSFDNVFVYNGSSYVDNTTEAGTPGGTAFSLLENTDNYIYIGNASQFAGIDFEFSVLGSGHTLVIEYSKGSSIWGILPPATITDNTSLFTYSGNIMYTLPVDWAVDTVNAVGSKYWIRIKTTVLPSTSASAYFIKPTTNVINLLSLSSSQYLQELWAWCSFGTTVYLAIRNSGSALYEGDYYITSASTPQQKQNFFVYNHQITGDYTVLGYVPDIGIAGGGGGGSNWAVNGSDIYNSNAGNVGVGTNVPLGKLHAEKTATDLSGIVYGIYNNMTVNPGANSTGSFRGMYSQIATQAGNAYNVSGLRGNRVDAYHYGTGTLSNLIGVHSSVANQSTGTVTILYGNSAVVGNNGGGIVITAYGAFNNISNTGTITNAYGEYVNFSTNTGTITNAYGLYINQVLGTNKWGVYVNDPSPNYFAGEVGIGTNASDPSAALDITSTTKGMLPPRMTTAQRDAIASPAAGLVIFNIDTVKLNSFNGVDWDELGSAVVGSSSLLLWTNKGETVSFGANTLVPVVGNGGISTNWPTNIVPIPVANKGIGNLTVWVAANTLNGNAVFTLQVGGSDSTITLTVPASTTGTFHDSVHSLSLNQDDRIATNVVTTAASSGSIQFAISYELV